MPPLNMKLLQALSRTAEPDMLAASGRKALGMVTDPNSQLKRMLSRLLLTGDGEVARIDELAQIPGQKAKFNNALKELGATYQRRSGYLKNTGLAAGAVGAGAIGASTVGVPAGADIAKRRIGDTVQKGLPQVPLADRLGFALKSIFAPSSAGRDINSLLNR